MAAVQAPVPHDTAGANDVHPPGIRRRPRDGQARRTSAFPPLRGLLPLAALLLMWQMLGSEGSPYFPPPSTWIDGVRDLWSTGRLRPAAVQTLSTFAIALGVATVLGVLLGLLVGASAKADRALGPTLEFVRAMPPAAIVPIAVLFIGYGTTMKVAVVTFAAMWSVLLNTRTGVRSLDPVLLDMARSLRLGPVERSRKCVLPALLPSIFLGVRVAAPLALVVTLLVEIVTRVDGVGALIANAQRSYLAGQVFGLILVAGLFSFVVNGMVSVLQGFAFRNRPVG
ncbi:MAG: ABC transporter permease subunit [Actinomycetota bacterium]|jgi:ABC-type nitrate/sulfonate/bicarbonate transport system permease component